MRVFLDSMWGIFWNVKGLFPTLTQRGRLFLFWTTTLVSYFYLVTLSQNSFSVFSDEFGELVKFCLVYGTRWIHWFSRLRGRKRLWIGFWQRGTRKSLQVYSEEGENVDPPRFHSYIIHHTSYRPTQHHSFFRNLPPLFVFRFILPVIVMIIIKYVSCLKKFVWDFKRGD